jgi:hypothetical protein
VTVNNEGDQAQQVAQRMNSLQKRKESQTANVKPPVEGTSIPASANAEP